MVMGLMRGGGRGAGSSHTLCFQEMEIRRVGGFKGGEMDGIIPLYGRTLPLFLPPRPSSEGNISFPW